MVSEDDMNRDTTLGTPMFFHAYDEISNINCRASRRLAGFVRKRIPFSKKWNPTSQIMDRTLLQTSEVP